MKGLWAKFWLGHHFGKGGVWATPMALEPPPKSKMSIDGGFGHSHKAKEEK